MGLFDLGGRVSSTLYLGYSVAVHRPKMDLVEYLLQILLGLLSFVCRGVLETSSFGLQFYYVPVAGWR